MHILHHSAVRGFRVLMPFVPADPGLSDEQSQADPKHWSFLTELRSLSPLSKMETRMSLPRLKINGLDKKKVHCIHGLKGSDSHDIYLFILLQL